MSIGLAIPVTPPLLSAAILFANSRKRPIALKAKQLLLYNGPLAVLPPMTSFI